MQNSIIVKILFGLLVFCILPYMLFIGILVSKNNDLIQNNVNENLSQLLEDKTELVNQEIKTVEGETENLGKMLEIKLDQTTPTKTYAPGEIPPGYFINDVGVINSNIALRKPAQQAPFSDIIIHNEAKLTSHVLNDIVFTEEIIPQFKQIIKRNSNLQWVYIITGDGLMRIYPYLDSKYFAPDHDQRLDPFYQVAKGQKPDSAVPVWTKPYYDYAGQSWIITCSYPVFHDNHLWGVVCMDIRLATLRKQMSSIQIGESGFAFMTDEHGDIIYHPDVPATSDNKAEVLKGGISKTNIRNLPGLLKTGLAEKIIAGKIGIENYQTRTSTFSRTIAYRPIKALNWRIGLDINPEEFILGSKRLADTFIFGLIFLTFFMIIFGFYLYHMLTKPLLRLSKDARSISTGSFGTHTDVKGSDELGILANSLNTLSDKIAERILFEQELAQTEKLAEIGQLAAGITHELKSPLTCIKGSTYLLERAHKHQVPDNNEEILSDIRSNIERAEQIVYNLLDFCRPATAKIEEAIIIRQIFEQILLLERENIVRQKIKISMEFKPYDIAIEGYVESLRHIFLNLFSNAVHAMAAGGELRIKASLSSDKIHCIISIADSGIGISENDQRKIFDPFYSTKAAGGHGLGLWIVQRELERMHGFISVKSETGKGSEFLVSLPINFDSAYLERIESNE